MKKILMLLGALILVGGLANAAAVFVTCVPTQTLTWTGLADGTVQTGTITCTPTALPGGDTLTSVEVYYLADYSQGSSTGTTINTMENANGGGSGGWGLPNTTTPYTCVSTGGFSSGAGEPCSSTGANGQSSEWSSEQGTLSLNPFTLSVTATLVSGQVLSSTYNAIVEEDYTTPAPEPASFMMVGGGVGLLGLAQVFGKYLKKKRS